MIKKYKRFLESKKKFPNIQTKKIDGYTILIGKDAESNDHLTTIMTEDEDMWFHVKGFPGSHVVVKSGDKLLTEDIIKIVAEITVKNSKAKSEKSVEVIYCKGKYVKKEPSDKPGKVLVDYNNTNKITIRN
jgi:predicted ribosome quality control (RQC) complex YloA/Tae2 family protein